MTVTSWYRNGPASEDGLVRQMQEAITEALVYRGVELPDEIGSVVSIQRDTRTPAYVIEIRWRVRYVGQRQGCPIRSPVVDPDILRRLGRIADSLYCTTIPAETIYQGDEHRVAEIVYRAARNAVDFVAGDLYAIQTERRTRIDTGLVSVGSRQTDEDTYPTMEANTETHRAPRALPALNTESSWLRAGDAVAAFSYAIQALQRAGAMPQDGVAEDEEERVEGQVARQTVVRGKRRIIINRG